LTGRALTLTAAHELLRREWPGRDAPTKTWVAYYERAAEVYSCVAEVDPGHYHEALFWAADAREAARTVAEKAGADK
jgi:hypothetical protein